MLFGLRKQEFLQISVYLQLQSADAVSCSLLHQLKQGQWNNLSSYLNVNSLSLHHFRKPLELINYVLQQRLCHNSFDSLFCRRIYCFNVSSTPPSQCHAFRVERIRCTWFNKKNLVFTSLPPKRIF